MDDNDLFLLDVFVKGVDYDSAKDTTREFPSLPIEYKEFFINSIHKSFNEFSVTVKNALITKDKLKKYSERICSIKNTDISRYFYNTNELLIVKRYDFNEFKKKMDLEFEIIHSVNGLENTTEKTSRAVFLLKKKKTI